jgi:hypothetical protein
VELNSYAPYAFLACGAGQVSAFSLSGTTNQKIPTDDVHHVLFGTVYEVVCWLALVKQRLLRRRSGASRRSLTFCALGASKAHSAV